MIQEELRNFIEQNCSGKEPSDLIMEAIGQKIEQLGADADEVLAFVEECAKGPTLEQKAAEIKRKENERLTFIEQLEKRLAEIKSDDLALYNTIKVDIEADIKKAKSVYSSDSQIQKIVRTLEEEKSEADKKLNRQKRNKKFLGYALLLLLIVLLVGGYSLFTGKMTISAKPQTTNDSLMDLRQKYYSCETWEDQLQYVMEPERVKPLMEKYYKTKAYSSSVVDNSDVRITRYQGRKHIIYKVDRSYLVKTDDGYKIDWEATNEYNPVSLTEMRNYPNKEFEYRVDMIEAGKNNIVAYYLYEDDFYVFPEKNSFIGKKLQELMPYKSLKGGAKWFVKLKYAGTKYGASEYEITEILSENWSQY